MTEAVHREDYPHWSVVPTRWNDNDVYGHVNNTVHYAVMDTVINAWLIEAGVVHLSGGSSIGLCVESGCQYLAPIEYPDALDVGLRVARLGTSSVTWEVAMLHARTGEPVAKGRFVHVFVDASTRRPTPLDQAQRAALGALLAG